MKCNHCQVALDTAGRCSTNGCIGNPDSHLKPQGFDPGPLPGQPERPVSLPHIQVFDPEATPEKPPWFTVPEPCERDRLAEVFLLGLMRRNNGKSGYDLIDPAFAMADEFIKQKGIPPE